MKKLLAMIALGAMVTGSSFAQTATHKDRKPRTERSGKVASDKKAKSPEEKAEKRAAAMAKKYNLTTAQQNQLKALHASRKQDAALHHAKGTEMTDAQRQAMKERREAMKASRAQYKAQLKAILTPEQYAQFEADHKSKKDNDHKGKRKGGSKRMGDKKDMKS